MTREFLEKWSLSYNAKGNIYCFILWESNVAVSIKIKIAALPLPTNRIIGTGLDLYHKL